MDEYELTLFLRNKPRLNKFKLQFLTFYIQLTKDKFKKLAIFVTQGSHWPFWYVCGQQVLQKILFFFYKNLYGIIFESLFITWFQVIYILAGRKTRTAN